jgi:hypothetical protein
LFLLEDSVTNSSSPRGGPVNDRKTTADWSQSPNNHARLQWLIGFHIVACCVSLACVSGLYPQYHLVINWADLPKAVTVVTAFATVSIVFVVADFSFGFLAGFYFYTMILGYLWLNCFSEFGYDHLLTGISAATSAIAFLLPALFINSPIRQVWTPSPAAFDRFLDIVLVFAVMVFAIGALYNFKPVGLLRLIALDSDVPLIRETLAFPVLLKYMLGITSTALLPFVFACFVQEGRFGRAGLILILLLFVYPITLTKTALFSPVWLAMLALAARFIDTRSTVILSLAVPTVIGIILFVLFEIGLLPTAIFEPYFSVINFRFVTIPSMAMDYYNEFFSKSELTHFCQIGLLKHFIACPYDEPLAIVIYKAFGIGGNFNASLFSTEGIASVGPKLAPLSALAAGLLVAFANRLSAGLPPRMILASGALLVQMLLNVPLSIGLVSYGGVFLFLLWYIAPRAMFEPGSEAIGGTTEVRPAGA